MQLNTKITLVFNTPNGQKKFLNTTFMDVLEKSEDDFFGELDEACTETGCNTESQNFCDCRNEDPLEIECFYLTRS